MCANTTKNIKIKNQGKDLQNKKTMKQEFYQEYY